MGFQPKFLPDSEDELSLGKDRVSRNKVGVLRQGYRLNKYEKLVL